MTEGRELTEDELDVEGEIFRLMFYSGAAFMAVRGVGKQREREAAEAMWKLIPFVKALGTLARQEPGRTRQLLGASAPRADAVWL